MSTNIIPVKGDIIHLPGFGPQVPRVKYIASFHHEPMVARRNHGVGLGRTYTIPANTAPRDFKILPVYDTSQLLSVAVEPDQPPTLQERPIPVEVVVDDLLNTWTRGFSSERLAGHSPGVGEVTLTPNLELPPDQAEALWKKEEQWCVRMVEEADEWYVTKEGPIRQGHRNSLEFLGSQDAAGHPWYREIRAIHMKRSCVTGKDILMQAFVDEGIKLVDFYLEYNLNPLDYGDTFLDPIVRAKKAEAKTSAALRK